jgi:hypothetical protein
MDYWQFFPAAEAGWGVVPVWGFATVLQSLHPGVAVGERVWGYWPMADHAVLQPDRLAFTGFSDAAPHRSELHAVYNQYQRCGADPFYRADSEDLQALLRPLFMTSWLIDDFLADNAFFGAATMLLSSASSKTAYGSAFHLGQMQPGFGKLVLANEEGGRAHGAIVNETARLFNTGGPRRGRRRDQTTLIVTSMLPRVALE